jgi:hypothetical protein
VCVWQRGERLQNEHTVSAYLDAASSLARKTLTLLEDKDG